MLSNGKYLGVVILFSSLTPFPFLVQHFLYFEKADSFTLKSTLLLLNVERQLDFAWFNLASFWISSSKNNIFEF